MPGSQDPDAARKVEEEIIVDVSRPAPLPVAHYEAVRTETSLGQGQTIARKNSHRVWAGQWRLDPGPLSLIGQSASPIFEASFKPEPSEFG